MRRSQSVRNHNKSSLLIDNDDLTMIREGEDDAEALRLQLAEKSAEADNLRIQIAQLRSQLADRPPMEAVNELRKEYRNIELLLDGTQRENERCMAELERGKQREKALESQLAKLAGPNWQDNLELAPLPSAAAIRGHTRTGSFTRAAPPADADVTRAHVEQVRLLVLGMEQRLAAREERLARGVEEARAEGARFEELRAQSANL